MNETPRPSDVPRITILIESYRHAGRTYGESHADDIAKQVAGYDAVFETVGMAPDEVAERVQAELLPVTERVFPDYVEELRGRSEGAGVPFRRLLPLSCVEEVWTWVGPEKMTELEELARGAGPMGSCTSLALVDRDSCVIGHNEDWSAVDQDTTMLLHDVTVPDGTRFLSLQLVGLLPWSGINSHGIAVTANTMPTTDSLPGAANAFVVRSLLESRSLEEVWERVRVRERGLGTYVLAADHHGRVWAMETSARRSSKRQVMDWTAETNHFTQDAMKPLAPQPLSEDSLGRLARASSLLEAGVAKYGESKLEFARRVLTDHEATGGRSICGHPHVGVPVPLQMTTLASTLIEPLAGRLWVSLGRACESNLSLFELS